MGEAGPEKENDFALYDDCHLERCSSSAFNLWPWTKGTIDRERERGTGRKS